MKSNNRDLTQAERVALEILIDNAGLSAVLETLSELCAEKADHIRESYGDATLARHWDTAAGTIGCFVSDPAVVRVTHNFI